MDTKDLKQSFNQFKKTGHISDYLEYSKVKKDNKPQGTLEENGINRRNNNQD